MSGIVSLALTGIATYSTFFAGEKGLGRARVYLWIAAGLAFAYANYKAWIVQHKKNLELQTSLDDRRAGFVLGIGNAIWVYDSAQNLTIFFMSATILNQGTPSIVLGWEAKYSVGSASEDMVSFYLLNPYFVMVGKDRLTVSNDDLLNVKTSETQIPRGGSVSGRLLLTLQGDRSVQLTSANYEIHLTCRDYLFTPFSEKYAPASKPNEQLMFHSKEKVERIQLSPMPPESTSYTPPHLREGAE